MVARYDNITFKAELTKEGWIIDKPVITRAGIFNYNNGKGKIVKEYRPDEEVFKSDSLNSLRAIPITDGHKGILSTNSELDGIVVGSVMSPGVKEDSNVVADIVIHNVKKIGSRRDLSLGYQCRIDETPGEFNGQKYDQVQRDITYNHLAVVNKGRAGNARIRLDSDELVSFEMETDMPDVTLVAVRLDSGITYQAQPEVAVHIKGLEDQLKDLKTRLDKSDAERDTAKAALVTANKEHEESLKKERDTARSRVTLEEKAKQMSIKFDGLSDREVKIAIAAKLGNKLDFKDRSDDYVDSAYDMTISNEESKSKTTAEQKKITTTKQDASSGNSGSSSLDARARMIARIRGEQTNKKDAA